MFSTPRRRGFILFMLGAFGFGLLAFTVYTVFLIRDCTSPGGGCYERQRAQREDNLVRINDITFASAWCSIAAARDPRGPNKGALADCVARQLARDSLTKPLP